tara:strand:- start:58 stop:267 length:210 start_codon:yes stop_codon:yes gene_type:complete
MIYKPTKKCELMRTKDSYVKKVNEWAVRNGYIQCAGCKGYGKEHQWIYNRGYSTAFPYCSTECYEGDEQ